MGKRGKQQRLLREQTHGTLPPAPQVVEADESEGEGGEEEAELLTASEVMLGGLSEENIAVTIQTLEELGHDLVLFRSRPFKRLRAAVAPLAHALLGEKSLAESGNKRRRGKGGRHEGTNLDGLDPDARLKQMDREALNQRVLRAERLARLEALNNEGGPGSQQLLLCGGGGGDSGGPRLLSASASATAEAITAASTPLQLMRVPDGPAGLGDGELANTVPDATLNFARPCYICKAPFRKLHFFYAVCLGFGPTAQIRIAPQLRAPYVAPVCVHPHQHTSARSHERAHASTHPRVRVQHGHAPPHTIVDGIPSRMPNPDGAGTLSQLRRGELGQARRAVRAER